MLTKNFARSIEARRSGAACIAQSSCQMTIGLSRASGRLQRPYRKRLSLSLCTCQMLSQKKEKSDYRETQQTKRAIKQQSNGFSRQLKSSA